MGDSLTTNLVTINITTQAPLKLNSNNYLSWRLQFQTLFIGYDLQGYIDGTKPCPTQQLTTTTNNITLEHLNPEYLIWIPSRPAYSQCNHRIHYTHNYPIYC
jgi:hypothetical protein